MLNSEYQKTIDWLFEQFPSYQLIGSQAYKPTLNNIRSICEQIGNPEKELKFIHIAGTNGKGSCSAMLASIIKESGECVGLFTSPHIVDFRERIRVNGEMISEQEVIDFVQRIKGCDLSFEPSFFEITFAMALNHFKRSNCTVCVIETGLGGRLDATNIIQPMVSLITNISLEHTSILGDTLEKIAIEKAGIIKDDTPVVIGRTTAETKTVFLNKAKSSKAPIEFAEEFLVPGEYQITLLGSYQEENLKSVLSVVSILERDFGYTLNPFIQKGLNRIYENTGFFGRMQIMQENPLIIFDVSHNPEGIIATLSYIKSLKFNRLHILYGSSSDKDILPILQEFPKTADLHLTQFQNKRSFQVEELKAIVEKVQRNAQIHIDPVVALKQIKAASDKKDIIIVLGSFFLLTDLMK